ncbi:MAG TPA: hypothetical protein VHY79_05765 [Rhizomicrobium sp.]|nr:hypothetical protein [Rhizomicrobium sp.]
MFKSLTSSLLLAGAVTMAAQAAEPVLAPPIAPEQIIYRHWPQQFVQWIGPELPYTMIELYIDPGSGTTPLYEAVLTERGTGKRVHYSNQQQMVDINKRSGADAYLTNMQFDRSTNGGRPTYLLRFVDHAGQPVSWQWIQGSDMSERGGGISPAGVDPPVLMYRGRSAVAGEGSALKIGNTVSTADVWSEISQPPYFIAFHGAFSENVDIAVFAGSGQHWTTISGPQTLAAGAEWKLKSEDGLGCSLRVKAMNGDHATILETDDHLPGRTTAIEATWTNGAWSIEKLHYSAADADANQGLTISFTPGANAGGAPSKFEVIAGRKTRIASGTVHGDPAQPRVGWEFKDPDWLRGKTAWMGSAVVSPRGAATETAAK